MSYDSTYIAGYRASPTAPRHGELHQGAAPISPQGLRDRFDTVVFCAEEYQPKGWGWDGMQPLFCPLDDSVPTVNELTRARRCGDEVAARVKRGERVLVTCMQGRNRSGLVNGYALQALGESPPDSVRLIQRLRPYALTNEAFVNMLLKGPKFVDVLQRVQR